MNTRDFLNAETAASAILLLLDGSPIGTARSALAIVAREIETVSARVAAQNLQALHERYEADTEGETRACPSCAVGASRFCVDCRYYCECEFTCDHPDASPDIVGGGAPYCRDVRRSQGCGMGGAWFEPAELSDGQIYSGVAKNELPDA